MQPSFENQRAVILPLTESGSAVLGGKAAGLARLDKLGLRIPKTFVVTETDFARADFFAGLESHLQRPSYHNVRWAVRSSANLEDGATHSFAGLFESFLDLGDAGAVHAALAQVFASKTSTRVRDYCRHLQIPVESLRVTAILQEFIEGEWSGVFFTIDPVKGDDRAALCEVVAGRGEALVAGHVTPHRLAITRDARVESVAVAGLAPAIVEDLRREAFALQAHYGFPVDIEFTVRANTLYFLQVRPITHFDWEPAQGQWTTADLRDGGISSSVPCTLMISLYENALERSMGNYMRALALREKNVRWARKIYGRLYWNLAAAKRLMSRLPGYSEAALHRDLGIRVDGASTTVTPLDLRSLLAGIPTLVRLNLLYAFHPGRVRRAIARIRELEKFSRPGALGKLTDAELHALFRNFATVAYPALEETYFRTVYLSSAAKQDFDRAFRAADPERKAGSPAALIANLGDLRLLQTTQHLVALARKIHDSPEARELALRSPLEEVWESLREQFPGLRATMDAFMNAFGHHADAEMDLRVPRWREDAAPLARHLKMYLENPRFLAAETATQAPAVAPHGKRAYAGQLRRLRKFLSLREEMRDSSTRLYELLRQCALETARRLEVAHGRLGFSVFDLDIAELLVLAETAHAPEALAKAAAQARRNRAYSDSFLHMEARHELGLARPTSAALAHPTSAALTPTLPASGATFTGLASSRGIYRGKARVVRTLAASQELVHGEILVAPFTDPGWTPLFVTCGAVVLETGGLLSHAAVISREYGLPSVLNVPRATELIKTGDELFVNGDTGEVFLLEPGSIPP